MTDEVILRLDGGLSTALESQGLSVDGPMWTGELLLSNPDAVTAAHLLDRIRQRLAEHNLRRPDLPIGIALGAATAEKGGLADALISADQRMYAEKARQKSHQAS